MFTFKSSIDLHVVYRQVLIPAEHLHVLVPSIIVSMLFYSQGICRRFLMVHSAMNVLLFPECYHMMWTSHSHNHPIYYPTIWYLFIYHSHQLIMLSTSIASKAMYIIMFKKNKHINKYLFNLLTINKRNIRTNIIIYKAISKYDSHMYRCRRHAELNSQASTQGCNTLRLTYAHIHQGSAKPRCIIIIIVATKWSYHLVFLVLGQLSKSSFVLSSGASRWFQ